MQKCDKKRFWVNNGYMTLDDFIFWAQQLQSQWQKEHQGLSGNNKIASNWQNCHLLAERLL